MITFQQGAPVRRRNRPSLVCEPCKRRKVKCDKGKPCESCKKNDVPHKCVYSPNWVPRDEETSPGTKRQKKNLNNDESDSLKKDPHSSDPIFKSYVRSALEPIAIISPHQPVPTTTFKIEEKSDKMILINASEMESLKDRLRSLEESIKAQKRDEDHYELPLCTGTIREIVIKLSYKEYLTQNIVNLNSKAIFQHRSENPGLVSSVKEPIQLESPPLSSYTSPNSPPINGREIYESLIGVNPYASKDDRINFFEGYTSIHNNEPNRRTNYGPFAWISILGKDQALRLLKQYTMKQKNIPSEDGTKRQSPEVVNKEPEKSHFENKEVDSNGFVDMLPYKNNNVKETSIKNLNAHKGQNYCFGNGPISENPDRELNLIASIERALPKKKVIWLLLERFFDFLYPYIPFVDEESFRLEISNILGPKDFTDEPITKLNITKNLDFAYIGMLFVFLRLAYLSILSPHSSYRVSEDSNEEKKLICEYLLNNPVNMTCIEITKSCLNQFQVLRKINLTILQCTFFLRLYHMYAPDEGDGADGGDSQIFNGMLVQMAYSIGLNREPDNFTDGEVDKKVNNVGRKIWYQLVISDFVISGTFGNPLSSRDIYYDTKIPFHEEGNSNLVNQSLEESILAFHQFCDGFVNGPMKKILELALNVKESCKMSDLTKHLNVLEVCTSKIFGRIEDYCNVLETDDPAYRFNKLMKLRIILSLKSFYLSIYYHFFLHYEELVENDLAFFYLKKMITVSIGEILPFLFPLVFGVKDIFGDAADLVLYPFFLQTLHRTSEVNLTAIVRLNIHLYKFRADPSHPKKLQTDSDYKKFYDLTCQMTEDMEKCARICIKALSELSSRYYYAWGVTKSHSFILKVVTSEGYYADNKDKFTSRPLKLEQIEELNEIYDPPLKLAEKIVNQHCQCEETISLFRKKKDVSIPLNSPTSTIGTYDLNDELRSNSMLTGFTSNNLISSEFEELNFSNTAEIDSLWLQLLSTKTDTTDVDPMYFQDSGNAPQLVNFEDSSRFNFFSDLPMEKLFPQNS